MMLQFPSESVKAAGTRRKGGRTCPDRNQDKGWQRGDVRVCVSPGGKQGE